MKRYVTRLGLLAGAVALLTACTAARKQHVLTFLFDGVPPQTPSAAAPTGLAAATGAEFSPQLPDLYLAARAAPPGMRHKPFAERECLSCHESQFSQKLRGAVAEICQLCHKSVFETRPFVHAPVAAGDCLSCHHPHESLAPALLRFSVWQVCADCHDEDLVLGSPAHAKIGHDACHVCHDPHGGQNRFFLKKVPTDRTLALLPADPAR